MSIQYYRLLGCSQSYWCVKEHMCSLMQRTACNSLCVVVCPVWVFQYAWCHCCVVVWQFFCCELWHHRVGLYKLALLWKYCLCCIEFTLWFIFFTIQRYRPGVREKKEQHQPMRVVVPLGNGPYARSPVPGQQKICKSYISKMFCKDHCVKMMDLEGGGRNMPESHHIRKNIRNWKLQGNENSHNAVKAAPKLWP